MHSVIASPFLDEYLLLQPGSAKGAKLPQALYEELRRQDNPPGVVPAWLVDTARRSWGLDLNDRPMAGTVLVRQPSPYGYCRASYELNLGCNYDCEHCYLGLKKFSGLKWQKRKQLLRSMQRAGVLWLQLTGGEPLIDRLFKETYDYAFRLGTMLSVSSNGSRLHDPRILSLFKARRPYRLTLSVYGASAKRYDAVTKRRGSFKLFEKGLTAAQEAGLPISLNLIVTSTNADETEDMKTFARSRGLPHNVFSDMAPTIYGGVETVLTQSEEHLITREPFKGCHAGHTFFHADPHGLVSICKVGRDHQFSLVKQGTAGLRKLGGIADSLQLRTGGCSGCLFGQNGTCGTCRPLAKLYQESGAPLKNYCRHGGF
ncbi:radical SAM protein [Streptomyces noboritoensis]|uniref:Radical SAM protein n=1 Tax=Streptomyces noboritoensis TaxID=67337 RepID=A0ABV6TIT9_9ACTN